MQATINLLNTLLPMLYAVAATNYSIDFFREDPFARKLAGPLLRTVVCLHGVYLCLRTIHLAHVPLASIYEVMTIVAFAVAVVYLDVERRTKTRKTGMFVLLFSFVFQTISSAFISSTGEFPAVLRSPLFGVHTGAAVLGYTAFAVSAMYGILFLVMYHELKANRFGLIYQRLPSLELLASMSLRASAVGLAFLTVTILFGALWASQVFPGFYRDPKFIFTVLVWCVYTAGMGLHYGLSWSGRRTIYFTLAGFALIIFSMVAARLWMSSFHRFA